MSTVLGSETGNSVHYFLRRVLREKCVDSGIDLARRSV